MKAFETVVEAHVEFDRWLQEDALPLWWKVGADREVGGFHELIGQDGAALARPRRARVQARQIFVYAAAGRIGWNGPWRQAVRHGLDFFLARYRRPDGLFRTLVGADGEPADETTTIYDQAFALFALAAAARVVPEHEKLFAIAGEVLAVMNATRRGPYAGFVEAGADPYQCDPHMHLFEASMALEAVGAGDVWALQADEIAELALARLIDRQGGFVREIYASDWTPAPGAAGQEVEPGHQFEWAWLLERWGVARERADARAAARRLYEVGAQHGVDATRHVAVDALLDDFTTADATTRLWPQTERLRAALLLASSAEGEARERYVANALDAAQGFAPYLQTPVAGLWRDKLRADGEFVDEPAPASYFYHIMGALLELRAQAPTLA